MTQNRNRYHVKNYSVPSRFRTEPPPALGLPLPSDQSPKIQTQHSCKITPPTGEQQRDFFPPANQKLHPWNDDQCSLIAWSLDCFNFWETTAHTLPILFHEIGQNVSSASMSPRAPYASWSLPIPRPNPAEEPMTAIVSAQKFITPLPRKKPF